ncbi:hypothetical protein AB3S75_023599 [Citrus x aurantiifolia]
MKSKHLLHLDIEAMRADAIELPCTDEIDEYGFIGVLKGVLHYANHNGIKLMIWQYDFLCKTDCFWILKHYISIHDLAAKHPAGQNLFVQCDSNMLKPYAIHPTSNIIFLGIPGMIFSYHLNMQKLELFFGAQDDSKIVWGQIFVFAYSCCFVILNDYSRTHWSFSSLYMLPPSPVSVEKRLSSLVRVSRKRVHANLGQFSGGSRMSPSLCLDRVTPTNVISITDGQSWSMFRTHSDSGGS